MKAILVADLSDPDDKDEYDRMMKSSKYLYVLSAFTEYLRQEIKYFEGSGESLTCLEKIRTTLFELYEDNGIKFD